MPICLMFIYTFILHRLNYLWFNLPPRTSYITFWINVWQSESQGVCPSLLAFFKQCFYFLHAWFTKAITLGILRWWPYMLYVPFSCEFFTFLWCVITSTIWNYFLGRTMSLINLIIVLLFVFLIMSTSK
jgi:hypothetical protein